jgi:hypothetical protein
MRARAKGSESRRRRTERAAFQRPRRAWPYAIPALPRRLKAVGTRVMGLALPAKDQQISASDAAKSGDGASLEEQLQAHQPPLVPVVRRLAAAVGMRRLGGAPPYSS